MSIISTANRSVYFAMDDERAKLSMKEVANELA
jgi:hypothetical protein